MYKRKGLEPYWVLRTKTENDLLLEFHKEPCMLEKICHLCRQENDWSYKVYTKNIKIIGKTPFLTDLVRHNRLHFCGPTKSELIIHYLCGKRTVQETRGKSTERTFFLSLMDPFPRMAILVIVSSWSLFKEFPFGPSSFPTKLNFWDRNKRDVWNIVSNFSFIKFHLFNTSLKIISYIFSFWVE